MLRVMTNDAWLAQGVDSCGVQRLVSSHVMMSGLTRLHKGSHPKGPADPCLLENGKLHPTNVQTVFAPAKLLLIVCTAE